MQAVTRNYITHPRVSEYNPLRGVGVGAAGWFCFLGSGKEEDLRQRKI